MHSASSGTVGCSLSVRVSMRKTSYRDQGDRNETHKSHGAHVSHSDRSASRCVHLLHAVNAALFHRVVLERHRVELLEHRPQVVLDSLVELRLEYVRTPV